MFKDISEILSKFTQSQRIIALLLLLFSITLISIGPKMVESLTSSSEELSLRVESQNTQIKELNTRVTELNTQIISNQKECTNAIVDREIEIMNQIADLEKKVKSEVKNGGRVLKMESLERVSQMEFPDGSDSTRPRLMRSPASVEVEIKTENPRTNVIMLEGLSKLKSNIKKDIDSKRGN